MSYCSFCSGLRVIRISAQLQIFGDVSDMWLSPVGDQPVCGGATSNVINIGRMGSVITFLPHKGGAVPGSRAA